MQRPVRFREPDDRVRSPGRRAAAGPSTVLAMVLAAGGCTQVTVHAGDGTVSTHAALGVMQIDLGPGRRPQVVETAGLGLLVHDGGFTVGYRTSSVAMLPPDDCRLVVWVGADASPAALESLLADSDRLCLAGPGAGLLGEKP